MKKIVSVLTVFAFMTAMVCSLNSCEKPNKNDPESSYNEGNNNGGNNGSGNSGSGDNSGNNGGNNGGDNGSNNGGGDNGGNNGGGDNGGNNGGGDNGGNNGGNTNTDIVETLGFSNVSSTSVILKGRINDNVNGELWQYGFIYSTYSNWLDVDGQFDSHYSSKGFFYDNRVGEFTYTATNLQANTTYYVRAYAKTLDKTYYGAIMQFSTQGGDYYIKHPWGFGPWSWNKMSKSGSVYSYTGLWGGEGANINTTPNDEGAMWYPLENIEGANQIEGIGYFDVIFTYNPETHNLSVSQ